MHSFRRLLIRPSLGMYTRSQAKQFSSSYGFTHDQSKQEFHLIISPGSVAKVEYVRDGDVLDLVYSVVPNSLWGKGIGHTLAKRTFDYIDQNKLKMRLTCEFLQKVYNENKNTYEHLID